MQSVGVVPGLASSSYSKSISIPYQAVGDKLAHPLTLHFSIA